MERRANERYRAESNDLDVIDRQTSRELTIPLTRTKTNAMAIVSAIYGVGGLRRPNVTTRGISSGPPRRSRQQADRWRILGRFPARQARSPIFSRTPSPAIGISSSSARRCKGRPMNGHAPAHRTGSNGTVSFSPSASATSRAPARYWRHTASITRADPDTSAGVVR